MGARLRVPDADICVCVGDVSDLISTSIAYLKHNIAPHMPVVLVLGNHDFYGSSINYGLEQARIQTKGTNIHLLENQRIDIDGCRFIGATLWTDFAVAIGGDEHLQPEERRTKAFELLPHQMADCSCIFRSDERRPGENGMVTVREILTRHQESRRFFDQELSEEFDGRTVVMSHHAPLTESFDHRFYGHVTNAGFASDLSDMIIRRKPSVWVHGHIHRARDYIFHKTWILSNPRGYGFEREMNGFQPGLVVDL
nr:metallophosphoesterase [Neorhizobium tomejilense]